MVIECDQTSKNKLNELYREIKESVKNVAREEVKVATISEICDKCRYLKLLHDPDQYDWFGDNNMKAVCLSMKAVIEGSLEAGKTTNIHKPLYCPNLDRELTKEEKEEAKKLLKWRQERWMNEIK